MSQPKRRRTSSSTEPSASASAASAGAAAAAAAQHEAQKHSQVRKHTHTHTHARLHFVACELSVDVLEPQLLSFGCAECTPSSCHHTHKALLVSIHTRSRRDTHTQSLLVCAFACDLIVCFVPHRRQKYAHPSPLQCVRALLRWLSADSSASPLDMRQVPQSTPHLTACWFGRACAPMSWPCLAS